MEPAPLLLFPALLDVLSSRDPAARVRSLPAGCLTAAAVNANFGLKPRPPASAAAGSRQRQAEPAVGGERRAPSSACGLQPRCGGRPGKGPPIAELHLGGTSCSTAHQPHLLLPPLRAGRPGRSRAPGSRDRPREAHQMAGVVPGGDPQQLPQCCHRRSRQPLCDKRLAARPAGALRWRRRPGPARSGAGA